MDPTKIKLNYINRSNDKSNSSIVIFQINAAESFDGLAHAWKIIENCGTFHNHPFTYTPRIQVGVKDCYGNYTPRRWARNGEAFEVVKDSSGHVLRPADAPAVSFEEVEVRNNLPRGAMDACVFRDNRLLAEKTSLAPGQKAVFKFFHRVYVGVVSRVQEEEAMDSAIIKTVNTEINLYRLASADIVMTGGGPGPDSRPFEFRLENVVPA